MAFDISTAPGAGSVDDAVAGETVVSRFLATVAAHPDLVALRQRDRTNGGWRELRYRDYAAEVALTVSVLRSLGVGPGDRVVMMMRNIPEFHICDVAISFCGATSVSIFNSSSPEQVRYLVEHCGAKVAIAEHAPFLQRFLVVREQGLALDHLIALDPPAPRPPGIHVMDELLAEVEPADLDEAAGACTPEQIATIIYTSGTTGHPKGVLLTHANVVWTVESLRRAVEYAPEELVGKRIISYLPMAHVAERSTSHYLAIIVGFEVTTCADAAKLSDYLREVRPQILFGVPRVWEKIKTAVDTALARDPDKHRQFADGVAAAVPLVDALTWDHAGADDRATYAFLDEVAFRPVREVLGLDQVEIAVSGAAPLGRDLLVWFRAIGVPLSEVYGLSETSGPMTWAPRRVKLATVGPPIPGSEVRLADDGEVLCRGGNIFVGYLGDPERTAEALDEDGWFHTGDLGALDDEGYLRIVDRKKELIITAGGKNVSPANLEAALRRVPLIGQACALGDRQRFVAALVTLDSETAPGWAARHHIDERSLSELARHPAVVAEIEQGVAEVMDSFNQAERVKKIKVLDAEWAPDSDVMTPTAKLKRRHIHERYAREIEELYR